MKVKALDRLTRLWKKNNPDPEPITLKNEVLCITIEMTRDQLKHILTVKELKGWVETKDDEFSWAPIKITTQEITSSLPLE